MAISLREIFTPLFAYVLLFVRTPGQRRSFEELRRDIARLLEEQALQVKRHDVVPQEYAIARFAVIAWIDELVLYSLHESNRELSQQWKRSPLQVEFYDTANAGEEFFERLDRLNPGQSGIREIYHLCLCLGFRGRYYDESQEYKLVALRRDIGQHLPTPVPDLLEIEKRRERITPQPYEVQPPPLKPPPRSYSFAVAGLVAVLCAAVFLYLFWPAPGRPRTDIVADIEGRVRNFTCCRVSVVDFQERNGTARLAGRVDSDEQRQQIRQAIKGVPEVTEVQDTFAVVPRPFCEVIDVLEPFERRGAESGFDLSVQPQKGCETTYYRAEDIVVRIAAQKPLRYVYVDYYVADRTAVAHLLPSPRQADNALAAATALSLGGPGSDTQWQVEPPFGMEMVTVVSSPQPLTMPPRPASDGVPAYLQQLRNALPSTGAATEVVAAHCLIATEDR